MYNKILVPLDGSKRAEAILPHVKELSQRYGAKVIFLKVIELKPARLNSEVIYFKYEDTGELLLKETKAYLAGVEKEFKEKGIEVSSHAAFGPVVEEIIDAAEREGVDLIALASHGRSGLSRVFYGSVAAGVLHRADRPLLLIRSHD
ncbi:universal stress protein [Thermodesulfobacteriota bacterium]